MCSAVQLLYNCCVQLWGTGARAPSTSNNFIFSSLWSKSDSQLSKYCVVCEIRWCRMQMSTTHSSFDQYCISHKTISHRAAAASGPEIRREYPMTYFPALPLLATNPGDATSCVIDCVQCNNTVLYCH